MDLNELFFRHQVALMRADRTDDCGERRRLGVQADGLATRIGDVLHRLGAPAAPPSPMTLGGCAA
jgi:hypothetical protein